MHEMNLPDNWKVARLGKLGNLVRGVTYKRQEITDTSRPGYLPVLRATNIQDRQLILKEELVYVKAEKVSDFQFLRRGDVIIAMSSGSKSIVGKAGQFNSEWEGSFGAFCAVFRHNSTVEPLFVGQIFQTRGYRKHLLKEARGTNINNLSKGHILDYQFPLPPLPEQRAIAHALQTIQEAKSTRQREIELERERKAALMDYLFSHGTKSEPRKQTEIGEIPESWEVVKLEDVLSYIGNGLTNKQNKVGDGYPVTRIETISDDCINAERVGYVNDLPNEKVEKYRLCYGDILLSHINSDPQLGRAVIFEEKPNFLLHGMNLLRMQANIEIINPFFLNFTFGVYRNRGVFIALASRAVGQSSINQSRMKSLMIPLPSLSEQDTIANILRAIDEKTAALEQEAQHLDELFHAMLDELMTGQRSAVPLIENGVIQ